jgi:hypothetical protein
MKRVAIQSPWARANDEALKANINGNNNLNMRDLGDIDPPKR